MLSLAGSRGIRDWFIGTEKVTPQVDTDGTPVSVQSKQLLVNRHGRNR